jgi:hypothetical protein
MDNLIEKERRSTHEDTIKEETFDEFLQRAYNQLTPDEQVQIRRKY